MSINFTNILGKIMVMNRDNGKRFLVSKRLDAISELLWNSRYRRIDSDGLYHVYSQKPLSMINQPLIIVSANIDVPDGIKNCWTDFTEDGDFIGTYENTVAAAFILSLMLNANLPENVVIAFTGDGEDFYGAESLCTNLSKKNIPVEVIISLGVTNIKYNEKADFIISGDHWNGEQGFKAMNLLNASSAVWYYVPEDPAHVPSNAFSDRIFAVPTEESESDVYSEYNMSTFSLSVPVLGNGDNNRGQTLRRRAVMKYGEALEKLLRFW